MMTYKELQSLTESMSLPVAGTNDSGENVIVEHHIDKWTYDDESWERRYFKLTTAQHNGWTRHNYIYEDGDCEEFYSKSAGVIV